MHHCADATQNVQPTCDELIVEQWKEVIMKQPYTDEHRIRVTTGGAGGRQLDGRPPPPAPFNPSTHNNPACASCTMV